MKDANEFTVFFEKYNIKCDDLPNDYNPDEYGKYLYNYECADDYIVEYTVDLNNKNAK